ncbi:phosphotransferase family protein [Kitasatospora aureofaciens]|uniref:phosphotransferase family protein n=1 Tax=Kitasatospora aureofaciens TaxID=1894 RepID=UPI001DB957D0|nr:phosphotransferase family protein [Kitasatospora aureofaciens]HJD81149.1 phosphotransferase family protein [Kitasatospora aureofaciens]
MSETPADPPGLDLGRLRSHLDRELPGTVQGSLRADLIEGGRSNLTYVLSDDASRWVLRRPPLGHVLATAHDMGREYRVMSALRDTDVPVPNMLLIDHDTDVLGAPWYLMEHVPGVAHRSRKTLAAVGEQRVAALGRRLVETLAALHRIDPSSVGLADFGRPDGYLERQLSRWSKQLAASRSRDLPDLDRLHALLADRLPTSPAPALVHGDYRLDNVLVDDSDTITAVLDWEMSTLGDPLTDIGLLVMYTELAGVGGGIIPSAMTAPGFPKADEIVSYYAELTGRQATDLDWYVAFASFKLAAVAEGIHYRFQQGRTLGAGFERAGEMAPILARHGLGTLKES